MKEFIALKPLEITIDSIGIHRYAVELAGDRYQVPLAPSQLCKPLPDIVHCVIMKTDTGIEEIRQDRFFLLKQFYGLEGFARFTVHKIDDDPQFVAVQVTVKDEYGLLHTLMIRKGSCQVVFGQGIDCRYRLVRSKEYDGVLKLQPSVGMENMNFVSPRNLLALCGHNSLLKSCFFRLRNAVGENPKIKMSHQIVTKNNLWVFTFANGVRKLLDESLEEKDWPYIYELCNGYLQLEEELRSNTIYLSSFNEDRKAEFLRKAAFEIVYCKSLLGAMALIRDNTFDRFCQEVLKKLQSGEPVSPEMFGIIVEACNNKPELLEANILTIAWIAFWGSPIPRVDIPSLQTLNSIIDAHVNLRVMKMNGKLNLEAIPVPDDELEILERLIGVQVLTKGIMTPPTQILKLAQIARFASYHSAGADYYRSYPLSRSIAYKSLDLLCGISAVNFGQRDLESDDLSGFIIKLASTRMQPLKKEFVYLDKGAILFDAQGVHLYPKAHLLPGSNLSDCNTLYSILKVKVNLCSQIVRGIDGLNLPDMAGAGAAWKKLFWRRDEQREKRKLTLPDGFYRLTYKGLSKTSNRLGYFIYTDKGVDEPQHCVLHTNRIFQVPGGTLEGLFTIGDEITAQVFSCEEFSGYQIDLRNQIQHNLASQIEAGDVFIAKGLERKDGRFYLYGNNGVLCSCPDADSWVVGKYYQVIVPHRNLFTAPDIDGDILGEDYQPFDALEVNNQMIKNFLEKHARCPYSRISRVFATELMFSLDRIADFAGTDRKRYSFYQFIKLIACIEHSKLSYLYDHILLIMEKHQKGQRILAEELPEDFVTKYPRLLKMSLKNPLCSRTADQQNN